MMFKCEEINKKEFEKYVPDYYKRHLAKATSVAFFDDSDLSEYITKGSVTISGYYKRGQESLNSLIKLFLLVPEFKELIEKVDRVEGYMIHDKAEPGGMIWEVALKKNEKPLETFDDPYGGC